jgi:hypothetical protein
MNIYKNVGAALHYAAVNGQPGCVKMLLDLGANVLAEEMVGVFFLSCHIYIMLVVYTT